MIYLLQVSTCWILFYSIYAVFLKKETFFSVNRYYLLGALFAGLAIPFVGQLLPVNSASTEVYGAMYAVTLPVLEPTTVEQGPAFTWMQAFWALYAIGAAVVASRIVHGLYRIWQIYQSADRSPKDSYVLVQSELRHLPFSFFNCIFISKSVKLKGDIEHVLKHEELHVNQWHSVDMLVLELLHVFFWFNPILIFYKKAIKQSHEYLADAYVTGVHEKYSYGQLLLGQSTSGLEIALANQFFNSQIKKRIQMMYKERSKKQAMVKYFTVVPVLLIALFIFSSNVSKSTVFDKEQVKQEITSYFNANQLDLDDVSAYVTGLNETYSEDRGVLGEVFSELNPIGGFTIDIKTVGDKFSTCVTLESKNQESTTDLYSAYVVKVDALLQERESQGDGTVATTMARVTESYLSRKLSKKHVEGYLDSQGINISIDDEGMVTLLAFRKPLGEKKKTNITVSLTPRVTLLNGVEISNNRDLKNELYKLLPDNTKDMFVRIMVDSEVKSGRLTKVLEVCSSLGVRAIVDDKGQESLEAVQIDDLEWRPASRFTFPEGSNTFRLKIEDHEEVVLKSDKMVYRQGVDYEVNRENGAISLMELSGADSDDKLMVYLLDKKTEDDVVTLITYGESGEESPDQGDPIIFVNGFRVEKAQYEQLKPEDIASVSVLKGEAAIGKYGEKGKAGVIEVTLKKEHSWISFLDEEPYKVVEHMPQFPGCEDKQGTPKEIEECAKDKMLKYIYENIKYPQEARDQQIEGMVVVQFVVQKDGSIADSKIVRDIGGSTGVEVLRIVDSMPDWKPGTQQGKIVSVLYTLPVRFKLESGQEEKAAEPLEIIDTNYGLGQQTSPLYLLDGKRIDKAEIADIKGVIVGINVVKGEEAMRKYGDAGAEGVVEISTNTKEEYANIKYTEELKLKGPVVYPQPSDGNFNVSFKTDSDSPVTINIYGPSGTSIKIYDGLIPEQGTINQQVRLDDFVGSAAFLNIVQDSKVYTEKLIIKK